MVVQPEEYGGVLRDFHEQVPVLSEPLLAEGVDHVGDLIVVIDLGDAGSEDLVPEQAHLLLKGAPGVYHAPHPARLPDSVEGVRLPLQGEVAQELVDVNRLVGVGVEKVFDSRLVPGGDARF